MNTQIKITEVTSRPVFKGTQGVKTSASSSIGEYKNSLDLPGIKSYMGKLLVPGYMPEDFVLTETGAVKGQFLNLIFVRNSTRSRLRIIESPKPANLHLPSGTYQPVMVDNRTGYFIHGTWTLTPHKPPEWSRSAQLRLIIGSDEWILFLIASPAKAWSEEELIKIAESMKEYEG